MKAYLSKIGQPSCKEMSKPKKAYLIKSASSTAPGYQIVFKPSCAQTSQLSATDIYTYLIHSVRLSQLSGTPPPKPACSLISIETCEST